MALSITVSAGAPSNIAAGVYEVTLTALDGPRTIYPQTGPNAGKEVEVLDWTFTTEDGEDIQGTTSTSSGPKSKLYAWLTALMGGSAPKVGTRFEIEQLVGRMAVATVEVPDSGWPKIANLSAMPTKRAKPVAVVAPVVAQAVDDDLPF
jgi:hypothetical protein